MVQRMNDEVNGLIMGRTFMVRRREDIFLDPEPADPGVIRGCGVVVGFLPLDMADDAYGMLECCCFGRYLVIDVWRARCSGVGRES